MDSGLIGGGAARRCVINRIITWRTGGEYPARPQAEPVSGGAENALDLAGGDPIRLRDLGGRHAVLQPRADARHVRRRNDDGLRRLLGRLSRFVVLGRHRRRGDCQDARSAYRFTSRRSFSNGWLDALRFGRKKRLGRLACARAPLATIAAFAVLW